MIELRACKAEFEPLVKWSGSKRPIAGTIARLAGQVEQYHEPFLGGGSVLGAMGFAQGTVGDIQAELVGIWQTVRDSPQELAAGYAAEWRQLQAKGHIHFYDVRDRFNSSRHSGDFLFLTRTCVNGLIRFNQNGEFNNSLHHTRPGIHPERLERVVWAWHDKIQKVAFHHRDFMASLDDVGAGDLVYLDPPYFNNFGRYGANVAFDKLVAFMEGAVAKGARVMLSYDGRRGDDHYAQPDMPQDLLPWACELPTGNSPFKKTQDGEGAPVYERLYCSWVPRVPQSLILREGHKTEQTVLGGLARMEF